MTAEGTAAGTVNGMSAEGASVTGPVAPAPPPGPGVQPPFVAPPTDGARQRRWIAIGVTAGVAVLCFMGALVGVGGLAVIGTQVVLNQAKGVVTDYLSALRDEQYADAYNLLCAAEKRQTSQPEFAESFARGPALESFEVGEPLAGNDLIVPATLHYRTETRDVRFRLVQDRRTGKFGVCGFTE
ncbi:MAG: hypothetical protein ACM30G_20440 [Micromonosporaceae bacterium]